MATFNSAIYLEQKEPRVNPSRLATPNVVSGDVEFALIPYTLAGTEAGTDTINLCLLPHDCIPLPMLSKVFSADPGTTLTLDIGNADNPDGWADGITLSSGGLIEFTSGTAPAWLAKTPLVADSNSGNAAIYATVASAASLTASVVLYFLLAWKRGK